MRPRTPSSKVCIASTVSRLGVPPIKIEESGRPCAQLQILIQILQQGSDIFEVRQLPLLAWELKSQ